ncbi:MAG: type II secretion system protein [Enterococcus sp.]|nr:type II secretion system protein [Enterococcus sp.]
MLTKLQEVRDEGEHGFTLVELLVVILIIGILSAIAIPAYLNQRRTAVDAATQADLKSIAMEIETMLIQYPDALYVSNAAVSNRNLAVAISSTTPSDNDPKKIRNTIKLSEGTQVTTVNANIYSANGYEIKATNPSGDVSRKGYLYQSNNGGIVPAP